MLYRQGIGAIVTLLRPRLNGQSRDHAGRSRVLEAMLPYFIEKFGMPAAANISSRLGKRKRPWIKARNQIAAIVGAHSKNIVLPKRADRIDNWYKGRGRVLQSRRATKSSRAGTEHKAVLDSCRRVERAEQGRDYLPVRPNRDGRSARCAKRSPTRPCYHHVGPNNEMARFNPECGDRER